MSHTDQFIRQSTFDASSDEIFDWHTRPGAFERLTPPWERTEVVSRCGSVADGGAVELRTRVGPFSTRWVAQHFDFEPGRSFRDVQRQGPFAGWEHTHSVRPDGDGACRLEDRIDYALPFGALGRMFGGRYVKSRLERTFDYRHRVLASDVERHSGAPAALRTVAISGASGLVGSALVPFLSTGGHSVKRLVRGAAEQPDEIAWSLDSGVVDPAQLEGIDAFVHLAGENIAARRWSAEQKRRIRDSRVEGTRRIAEAIAALETKPEVFVCASAIGFYGDRGDEVLTEASARGDGFLPEVCEEWEAAVAPLRDAGVRVVHLRFGVILSPAGGALAKMLTPFRMGAGGRLGSGRQWMSWIALDDAVGAIHRALVSESLSGPVNVVAPNPVTNADFTKTLGRVLNRPTVFPMPAFAARAAFGELADALLLEGQRVLPEALEADGFRFDYPELEGALRHLLGR